MRGLVDRCENIIVVDLGRKDIVNVEWWVIRENLLATINEYVRLTVCGV